MVLKLMIAEDEALERKALRFLLDKYYSKSIQVIHEVSNGRDAVEKAIACKVDIILMDIHMPILDGLEASSVIKNNCKDTEIIILTAYNYFDYAKKAIKIGVCDYLLKPFSNDEFINSIDKVIEKVKSKNSRDAESKELRESYKRVIPYIEKQMVANIAYGVALTGGQVEEYKDILNINSTKFCCILFSLKDKKACNESSINEIKNKLNMLFPKIVGGLCLNDIIFFIFHENVENIILSKGFENILNNLREGFMLNKAVDLTIGVGSTHDGLHKLYLSYKEAKRSSESKGNKKIIENSEMLKHMNDRNDISEMEHILCGKLINEDLSGAIVELNAIMESLFDREGGHDIFTIKKMLLDLLDNITENINEFIGKDFKNFNKEKMLQELINLRELSELKNCTNMILKNFINYISSFKRSKNIDVVEKVKKYIETNYARDISLEQLSQYVSMSSFYLSRIFTKVEQISFREYLIKIRMEKAKCMLREGNRSIKQISMEVGYVDQNYFSKAFKKYTNVSPTEYCNL